jgi:hypothetical protein
VKIETQKRKFALTGKKMTLENMEILQEKVV